MLIRIIDLRLLDLPWRDVCLMIHMRSMMLRLITVRCRISTLMLLKKKDGLPFHARNFLKTGIVHQIYSLCALLIAPFLSLDTSSFKVAPVTSENGVGHSPKKENGNIENKNNSVSGEGELGTSGEEQLGEVSDGESHLQKEDLKKQTALLLHKFENSHFFVRISESDDPLWSKRSSSENFSKSSDANNEKASTIKSKGTSPSSISAVIDRGNFDSNVSSGVARNSVKCCALPNGDIVDAGSFTSERWC